MHLDVLPPSCLSQNLQFGPLSQASMHWSHGCLNRGHRLLARKLTLCVQTVNTILVLKTVQNATADFCLLFFSKAVAA